MKTTGWRRAMRDAAIAAAALALGGFAADRLRETSSSDAGLVRFSLFLPTEVSFSRQTNATVTAISPDGRRVAFVATEPGRARQAIWLRALDQLEPTLLKGTEHGAAPPDGPFWSPDSRKIAFFSGGRLLVADIQSGPVQVLCNLPGVARGGGAWSRDGSIIFGIVHRGMFMVPATGGEPVQATKAYRKLASGAGADERILEANG